MLSVHRGRTVIVARITNFSKGSVRLPQPWCPPPAANSDMLGRGHDLICVVEPTSLLPLCWVLPSCNRPDIVAKACWPSAEVKLQYFYSHTRTPDHVTHSNAASGANPGCSQEWRRAQGHGSLDSRFSRTVLDPLPSFMPAYGSTFASVL